MAEEILADPLTARIVDRLTNAHLRLLKRKTKEIRDFHRRFPHTQPPQKSIALENATHGIPQVGSLKFEWKCTKDGSEMNLKARVDFGIKKAALSIYGQQGTVLAELPAANLAGMHKDPIEKLIATDLLEGYAIHRVVGKTVYLKLPSDKTDISLAIEEAPVIDIMARSDFLRFLLEIGITRIDRSAYKFLKRTQEYSELKTRIERIMQNAHEEGKTSRFEASDLMSYLAKGARIYFLVKSEEDGPKELTIHYIGENAAYSNNVLTWSGSMRKDWYSIESHAFSHIHRYPGRMQHRNRMRPIDIKKSLTDIDTDREILL